MEGIRFPEWFNGGAAELAGAAPEEREELQSLLSLAPEIEEEEIVKDLIYCLAAAEGSYIYLGSSGKYELHCQIRESIRSFVDQVLPTCNEIRQIEEFSLENSEFGKGKVLHALSSSLQSIISDFLQFLSKLEAHRRLTLPLLVANIRSPAQIIHAISQVLQKVESKRGCQLLSEIHKELYSFRGSKDVRNIISFVFQSSSAPLLAFIEKWVYSGEVEDPFNEFFIGADSTISPEVIGEEYECHFWEKRFFLVDSMIPSFFSKSLVLTILSAGKSVAVLNSCGFQLQNHPHLSLDSLQRSSAIEAAAAAASNQLLGSIREKLIHKVKVLKDVLLGGRSDWITSFYAMAKKEMKEEIAHIPTLDSALFASLPSTYSDEVSVIMESETYVDLVKQIHSVSAANPSGAQILSPSSTSWDFFDLKLKVEWPMSIILNHSVQSKYQLLFRTGLQWRIVEERLCKEQRRVIGCRQIERALFEIIQFASSIIGYHSLVVIHPLWESLEASISLASDMDGLIKAQSAALDEALKGFFISDFKIFGRINLILFICRQFIKELRQWRESAKDVESEREREALGMSVFKYQKTFEDEVRKLLQAVESLASRGGFDVYYDFVHWVNSNKSYGDI